MDHNSKRVNVHPLVKLKFADLVQEIGLVVVVNFGNKTVERIMPKEWRLYQIGRVVNYTPLKVDLLIFKFPAIRSNAQICIMWAIFKWLLVI